MLLFGRRPERKEGKGAAKGRRGKIVVPRFGQNKLHPLFPECIERNCPIHGVTRLGEKLHVTTHAKEWGLVRLGINVPTATESRELAERLAEY